MRINQFLPLAFTLTFFSCVNTSSSQNAPRSIKFNVQRGLISGGTVLAGGYLLGLLPNPLLALTNSEFPIKGSEEIMKKKLHGTSDTAVQQKLKWGCDVQLADRICNYNRRWAEHAGLNIYSVDDDDDNDEMYGTSVFTFIRLIIYI